METFKAATLLLVIYGTVKIAYGANTNCEQTAAERVECTGGTSASSCKEQGCWWCDNGITPKCTEGTACSTTPYRNCWPDEAGTPNKEDCRKEYGCSWCEDAASGTPKCRQDFIPDQTLTCAQPLEDLEDCNANTKSSCLNKGCWWCAEEVEPRCVRGLVCSLPNKVNCWDGPGAPNKADCRKNWGCSWCPDSPVKCAKEFVVPMPGPDACSRPASRRTNCPVSFPDRGEKCPKEGCWWCPGGILPTCVRGGACDRKIALDCWPTDNTDTPNKEDCRIKYGCSWCPTTVDGRPECLMETDECDRWKEDRQPCLKTGQTADKKTCLSNGCFWCDNAFPRCTTGKPCSQSPKENCWPDPDTTPTAEDCRKKYRCAWCEDSTPQCVKPQPLCYHKDAINCYPFKDPQISTDDCLETPGCFHCPLPSNRQVKCVRAMCAENQVLRYGQNSCCNGSSSAPQPRSSSSKIAVIDRIVGGVDAALGNWPWQGSMQSDGSHVCGSVLIKAKYSLSAAHCERNDSSVHTLSYGFIDLDSPGANVQTTTFQLANQIIHPDYSIVNDIMLIKHDDRIDTDDPYVFPIDMPRGEEAPYGTTCFVTGWGSNGTSRVEQILQEVAVDIFTPDTCVHTYGSLGNADRPKIVCAGLEFGGGDSCQGDSGGPLVCQRCNSCDWYLKGLVSFGIGCAIAQFPGVYANVGFHEAWVKSIVNGLPDDSSEFDCDFY